MRIMIIQPNSGGLAGSGKGTALITELEGARRDHPQFLQVLDGLRRLGFEVIEITTENASSVATESVVKLSLSSLMTRVYEGVTKIYWGE